MLMKSVKHKKAHNLAVMAFLVYTGNIEFMIAHN